MDFLKTNFHTHTYRCKHAENTEVEYIEAAIRMGIHTLGFSDHIPCPYKDGSVSNIRMTMEQAPEYVSTIRELGERYKDDIEILCGFEAEYIPEFFDEQMRMYDELGCDYLIMGQHFLTNEFEGPYMGTPTEDEARIRAYVDQVTEGMETGAFMYLAHPDLINFQGMDSVYDWEMTRLCKNLKKLNIPVEINMIGISEGKHYPDDRFWRIAGEVGNQVVMGLDAHCLRHMTDVETYQKAMKIVQKYDLKVDKRWGP